MPRSTGFPNPGDPNHLASIEVNPQPPGELDVTLAAAIARRRTDRRNYSYWPVPGGDIALMGARAARAGVMLRQIDLLPQLHAIVAKSVSKHATDSDYLSELNAWSGRYGSVAGVPARNTPAIRSQRARFRPGSSPVRRFATAVGRLGRRRQRGDAGSGHRDRRRPGPAASRRGHQPGAVVGDCDGTGHAARSPSRSRSPKRVTRSGPTCSAPAATRRCCCGSAGRRSTPIRCRPRPRRPLPEVADWLNDGAFIVGSDVVSHAG